MDKETRATLIADVSAIMEQDEQDNPTCWAIQVGADDRRNHYIWILKYDEKEYKIENSNGYCLNDKTYKTLRGAYKIAKEIGERQSESGFFTD